MSNLYGDYKGDSPYTLSSAITEFPYLQDVLRNPTTLKLADYANFNDTVPVHIKIERKTYTTQGEKYNEHYIHLDTVNISTFKSYVYLNDVSKKKRSNYLFPKIASLEIISPIIKLHTS